METKRKGSGMLVKFCVSGPCENRGRHFQEFYHLYFPTYFWYWKYKSIQCPYRNLLNILSQWCGSFASYILEEVWAAWFTFTSLGSCNNEGIRIMKLRLADATSLGPFTPTAQTQNLVLLVWEHHYHGVVWCLPWHATGSWKQMLCATKMCEHSHKVC